MKTVAAVKGVTIPLGRQGENAVTTVVFSTAVWPGDLGDGEFRLVHRRANDTAPYPCSITVDGAGNVCWVIGEADVFDEGLGCAQLTYVVGEQIAKSVIFITSTLPSLGEGQIPQPVPSWLQEVFRIGEKTIADQGVAEKWAAGTVNGVPVPEEDTTYHNNSKFYAGESEESAIEAANSAHDAAESEASAAISAQQAAAFVGSPLTAETAAGMTDHSKVYVYVGSESGYTAGHWYYYNGTAWADGGVYNAVAVDIATSADIQEAFFS